MLYSNQYLIPWIFLYLQGVEGKIDLMQPMKSLSYTWDEPSQQHVLQVSIRQPPNNNTQQQVHRYEFKMDKAEKFHDNVSSS